MGSRLSRRGAIAVAGAAPPPPIIGANDSFNRADSATSLGTADSGQLWAPFGGTWGVIGNQAYCSTHVGFDGAVVETHLSDCTVGVTLPVATSIGLVFRYVDSGNYLMVSNGGQAIDKYVGGSLSNVLGYFAVGSDGDRIEVVLSGTLLILKRNGAELGRVTDSSHQTATQHGLLNVGGGSPPAGRFDTFSVA